MLRYRGGPESDPFYQIYQDPGWLYNYDPPRIFPFWINLEPTNRCQLNCLFCSRQLSRRPLGHLNLYQAQRISDEASRYPQTGIRLTGWGEPLLHPRIKELLRIIKGAGLPLKIYTNALALTQELFIDMMELQVEDLQFSMQGLTPKQYEFNRQGAKYDLFRRNVEMAAGIKARQQAQRPFLSILTSVLADECEEADPEVFFADWLTLVDKVAIDLTNLNFVAESARVKKHLGRQSQSLLRKPCVDIFLALEVKNDGAIQICGQDANGRREHTLGWVGQTSLAEAWMSPRMESHRQLVGRGLGHEASPVCRNCFHNTQKYELFKNLSPHHRLAEKRGTG